MTVDSRFIKIDGEITEHWVAQQGGDFFLVWIHLICIAQWKKSKKPIKAGKKEMYLDRGEFCTSMDKIAADLHLKVRRVRTILDTLKENDMISKLIDHNAKDIPYIARVVNYDKWQGKYSQESPTSHQQVINKSSMSHDKYKGYNTYNDINDISERDIYNVVCKECQEILIKETEDRNLTTSCKCGGLGEAVKLPKK